MGQSLAQSDWTSDTSEPGAAMSWNFKASERTGMSGTSEPGAAWLELQRLRAIGVSRTEPGAAWLELQRLRAIGVSGTEPGAAVAGTSETSAHRGELGLQSLVQPQGWNFRALSHRAQSDWNFRAWCSMAGTSETSEPQG